LAIEHVLGGLGPCLIPHAARSLAIGPFMGVGEVENLRRVLFGCRPMGGRRLVWFPDAGHVLAITATMGGWEV